MATTRRIIVARSTPGRDRAGQLNTWLLRHATLDIRGGGDKTFTVPLNLTGDPADPPVAYWCSWLLPDAWWQTLQDRVVAQGWGINETTNAAFDIAHYPADTWTPQQALDDLTRKPAALKVIEVPL